MTRKPDDAAEGLRCFICKAAVPPRPDNRAFPFCSDRCQLIDLGSWLSGDYRIPADATVTDESTGEGDAELDAPSRERDGSDTRH